jgi:hypothetical protein
LLRPANWGNDDHPDAQIERRGDIRFVTILVAWNALQEIDAAGVNGFQV